MATVAFCPTDTQEHPLARTVSLKVAPFIITPPPANLRWINHVAANLAGTSEQLVLVFHGESSQYAPALGFSRKSLRCPAVGYVLVDPVMPQVGGDYGDWPDAPVTIVLTEDAPDYAQDAARSATLRGWQVTTDPLSVVLSNY